MRSTSKGFRFIVLFFVFVLVLNYSFSNVAFAKGKKNVELKGVREYIFVGDSFVITPKVKKSYKKNFVAQSGQAVSFTYKSSNKKVATVSKNGKVKGKKKGKVKITISSNFGYKKVIKLEVKGTDKLVVLSFDDGPSEYTPRLLEAMKKNGYHGTFFMVGNQAQNRKSVLKTMVKYGNEVGMHSWQHDAYGKMEEKDIIADINKTRKLIKDYTGVTPKLVRPPYGSKGDETLAAFKKAGSPCIMWNTDIEDWKTTETATVEKNILNRVHPGAVLVIHDSHSWSVNAIINAMPKLKKKGYELVTVSEFARIRGINLSPGSVFTGTSR